MQFCKLPGIRILLLLIFIIFYNNLKGQITPEPCTDPNNNGIGCFCSTAGILCTPDDLDGFKFLMSDIENDGDLPTGGPFGGWDLCPGDASQDGFPNNVNFFAFIVWCESITFDVLLSDCVDYPGAPVSFGVQMALFANCGSGNSGWDPVSCITNGNETCYNTEAAVPAVQTFSASGLEIGGTYYFMVDGCGRSTCTVTIQVQGTCGTGEISPWINGLTGPTTVCVGDTETYVAEDPIDGLDGAEEYYYYLDGVPFTDGEELFNLDVTWDTPGTYELCVDVSNLPCLDEDTDPAQNCITVFVAGPGNGDIVADPEILCPDETSSITVSNNNSDPLLTNYIILVGPDGTVVQVLEGLATSISYDKCGDFTAYYYSFLTSQNPTIPAVGDVWVLPDCLVDCCSLENVVISFEDDENPVFTMEPADITLDCADDIAPDESLTWTDNCAGTGDVMPVVDENYTLCDGGTVVRTWSFTDSCANNVEHIQTITIDPIPLPVFTTLPADSIINCDTAQFFVPLILEYTNSAVGACDISGTITPTSVGTFDLCGSSVVYTWEYEDMCNRTITHSQTVTVEEVGAANDFIDPPDDITISCMDWLTFTPETLNYSNDQNGSCEISGSVDGVTSDTHDACGNSITFMWEFTDACGRKIEHAQIVTVEPAIEAAFIDAPTDITINCDELQVFSPAVLSYTNSGTGACLIEGTVDPVGDGTLEICGNSVTYTWDFTDDCGRPLTHSQTVTTDPVTEATFVDPPGNVTISCDELQVFTPAVLTYTNGGTGACLIEGTVDPVGDGTLDICGNSVTYTWDFTDDCGRPITHSQIVTVDPVPEAAFVATPGDVTISCDELQVFTPAILTYTNGGTGACLIEGTVDPVGDGTLEICGNSVTYTWDFTDDCGRPITHSQTVTVDPIPEAAYVDPPGDVTISCDELQVFSPAILTYTNGGTGACLIEGTVDPVGDGTLEICGNSVTYTWDFTDDCGRPITHSQTVTVDPVPEATYVDPPGDITITCDELQVFAPAVLSYTNGGTGACLIEGMVDPVGDGTLEICGNSVTYTWDFTDDCGRPITHSQTVTVDPVPEATYVDPPGDITITCDELQAFAPAVLSYTNGGTGACLIEGMVDPVGDGTLDICGNSVTYTWDFTDDCGRPITHSQVVTVEPIAEAAFVDPPGSITINCDELQAFAPAVLSYTNGGTGSCLIEGTVDPVGDGTLDICGNSVTYTWDFTDDCGRPITHSQVVTVEPIAEAAFVDPPGSITINCDELQAFAPAVLSYTNGGTGACLIEGTVDPVGDGTLDICGNSVTYTWEFIDDCSRPITHTQTITVEPIAPPAFIDPLADETVNCGLKPNEGEGPVLNYTNGGTDACETAGEVTPTEEYNVTECGGTIVYTWEFTDDCGTTITESQTITVDPAPQAQFEDLPPSSITIECNENTDSGPDLVVTNNENGDCLIEETITPTKVGDADNCGGSYEFVWEFTDDCGRTTTFSQTVNVNPAPIAVFDNIPVEIDIDCDMSTDTPDNLLYSNGDTGDCEISGDVPGVRTGTIDYCGGTLVDSWVFIDECGRQIMTERNVNVAPAPPAEYVNAPADIIVDCANVNSVSTTLNYSNGESGVCLISGVSVAVVSGSYDNCGGSLIYTWSFVDDCGRPISYSQNITVDPAPDPAFINPPGDLTIGCDDIYNGAEILNYTNGASGVCELFGAIIPITTQDDNIITNTWEYELPCSGEFLTHVQTVTLSIVPDISISPGSVFLCLGDSYDLQEVIVDDAAGTNITVTYHSAFPPTAANEISPIVDPTSNFNYVINATNEYGCEDFELISIFIEEPPYAGEDQSTTVCSDGFPLNLFDFIPPFADQSGSWLDLDGIGANISNPFGATFNNVAPGNYMLYYIVYSTTVCENDTMVLNVEVIEDVMFEITEVTCIGSNDFYEVYINSNGFDIQATEGMLTNVSGNDYVITNIPISTGVFISAFETVSGCSVTVFVDIPNCDCPDIGPPTGENISICVDEQPVILSVSVPAGMTANWYETQNSNTSLLDGSLDFTIQGLSAGVYSYFVETYDPATDCSSNVKLKIDVEVNDLPDATDASVIICDLDNDGSELISLQSFNNSTNTNPANVFTYYISLANAESQNDPLTDAYTLSLGSNPVFVRIVNSATCVSYAQLDLILTDLPDANVTATAPSCIADQDGVIDITPIDIDGTMMTSLDGILFTTDIQYNGLAPGNYTVYIQDENECQSTYDVVIPDGLEILFTTFTSECNDNGTNTDPTDDFYTISLLIENNKGNTGTFNVIFNGSTQYTFSYGNNESFEIPVDQGNNIDIVIADTEFLCIQNQTFGPLNPCSTNCEVSIDALDFMCNNGGTETDPSDDFYTVTINASAMNGSQNGTYNVFLDGVLLYNFDYEIDETFQVAASGNNLSITCQDNEDVQCQTSQEIGPLITCSGGCQITLDIVSSECSNNGTATIQTDDFYTYTINGNIINGDALTQFELFVDGVSQGSYNYGEDIVFDVPADEMNHIISISDNSNSGCVDAFTTEELTNCSTDCEIILNEIEEECFDNGTPQDSDDDFYEITINASSVNGASNQMYNLLLDGTFLGAYPYDQDNVISVSADGAVHTILVQDSEQLACELELQTMTLVSCSNSCLNELSIQDFECFDNGTATNIDDDYYEFDLIGTLINGDGNSTFQLLINGALENTYSYNDQINITLPADGMIYTIMIVDVDDPNCTASILTQELISCSTDCEIISENIGYQCMDNGTPTDPSDDFIEITVNASAINGSTTNMYNLYFDGVLEGIFAYGSPQVFELPADGQVVTLRFQDSQDLQCDLEVDTEVLSPCSDGCLIGMNIINVECFNNGTPTDVNDDYYEITIQGEILNGTPSPNIDVLVDNVSQGTTSYGNDYVVTIPADGFTHIIDIADEDDSSCSDSYISDALTSCSTDCEIALIDYTSMCFDNGTLDDPSDDYYEVSFSTSSINGSTGYSLTVSGIIGNNYNYGEVVNLTFSADGANLVLVLTDLTDEQCKANQVDGPFDPCSNLCTIEPMIMESQCFDNGTPIDPSDDYWEITLFVNPANGETAPTFDLRIDGVPDGTYLYSQNNVITIPADNATHVLTVNDTDDITCDATVTTGQLTFCSTPCEISVSYDNVTCENNGTNDTGDDDIYYVDLLVSDPNAGQFEIPSLSIVGMYNQVINIGPFNISDGMQMIQIVDSEQNLCTIQIELVPPVPCSDCVQTVDAGTGGTISCDVSEIDLLGAVSEIGTYSWYGPAGNLVSQTIDATAVSIGTYTFSVLFEDGCVAEDSVIITADTDLPIALLTSNGDITCNKPTTILDGSLSGTTNDFIFYWYDENNNLVSQDQSYETDIPGVYFLQVETISNNCKSALEPVQVIANINEPTAIIYALPDSVIDCVIKTITLATDQEDNVNYTWFVNGQPFENVLELEVSEIGTYGLTAVDTITGCVGDADIEISSLVGYPNIDLDAPEMLDCDSEEISIFASSIHIGENLTSVWLDENQNTILENEDELLVSEPGLYYYTLTDNDNGCENTDSIMIELFENDVEIVTIPEITYIEGQTVILTANVNLNSSEIGSIQWSPDENMSCSTCLTTQISDPTDSIYTITITDIYGCQDSAQVRLDRTERPEIYIPNVFNPNSNSGNNTFAIFGNSEVEGILNFRVFDRWGNLVYTTATMEINNPSSGWDGTFNGKNVEQGVYVYSIEVLFKSGSVELYHGDLTIIR